MSATSRPPKVARPVPVPRVPGPLDAMTPDEALAWWDGRATPHVEEAGDDVLVTFVWEDEHAEQVLLWANRLADETDLMPMLLRRLDGTSLWHATFRMSAAWRASYCFLPVQPGESPAWLTGDHVALRRVLDRGLLDPRNPEVCRNGAGVRQSVVSGPDAPAQPWLTKRPGAVAGRLEAVDVDGRDAWLHTPVGLADGVDAPTVIVLDGETWTREQDLPTTLDNLYADGVVVAHRTLFVSSGGRERRWEELGDPAIGTALVLDQAVPWVRRHLATSGPVTLTGQSLGALTALRVGLRAPDVVGSVLSQSASLWQDDLHTEIAAYVARRPAQPLRIHLAHGTEEWLMAPGHLDLAPRLAEVGIDVRARPYHGGHDYAWWRGAMADGLVELGR